MDMGPDIASMAALIGDPVRASILAALIDGRALPAGELAFIGNVAPQTASFHLSKLLQALLITVERQGKYSYYRLANDTVASALESLAALVPVREQVTARSIARRESEAIRELRFARSCYKHLAGRLAIEINKALLEKRFTVPIASKAYSLTGEGREWCREVGVRIPQRTRAKSEGRACLDWTERRHHLGGPLGMALFARLKEIGWLATNSRTRAVRLTHSGSAELYKRLGITCSLKSQVSSSAVA